MKNLFIITLGIISILLGKEVSEIDQKIVSDSDHSPEQVERRCGLSSPTLEEMIETRALADEWMDNRTSRDYDPVHVFVAWHVIHSTSNAGNIPASSIETAIQRLNVEYNEDHNIFFTLDTITRTENDEWFYLPDGDLYGPEEEAMRQATYIDPYHYYNVWSCDMSATGAGGWNYFPWWNPEGSYWQGTTVQDAWRPQRD